MSIFLYYNIFDVLPFFSRPETILLGCVLIQLQLWDSWDGMNDFQLLEFGMTGLNSSHRLWNKVKYVIIHNLSRREGWKLSI